MCRKLRHDRIADVIESTTLRGIYEILDEFDFSTDASVAPPAHLKPATRTERANYCGSRCSAAIIAFPSTKAGDGGMEFVQILEFKTSKFDEIDKTLQEYRAKREAAGAPMPVQVLQCKDRDQPNTYVAVVRFPSYEAAMENSNHPDTAAMAERLAALSDGPAQFRNFDLVNETTS